MRVIYNQKHVRGRNIVLVLRQNNILLLKHMLNEFLFGNCPNKMFKKIK